MVHTPHSTDGAIVLLQMDGSQRAADVLRAINQLAESPLPMGEVRSANGNILASLPTTNAEDLRQLQLTMANSILRKANNEIARRQSR